MVTPQETAAFFGSLKIAGDIASTLLKMKISADVQAKVIQLQDVILDAQSKAMSAQQAEFAAISRVRELEEEVARLKSTGGAKERYELQTVDPGALAYVLKPEAQGTETPHWLCVPCFDSGHKSVLQNQGQIKGTRNAHYGCPKCKAKITVFWRRSPDQPFIPA